MQKLFTHIILFVLIFFSACSSEEEEKKEAQVSKDLQYFNDVGIQSFNSNYGTLEILLPQCIKEGYTTQISITDINNRVCESKGIFFSVDAITTYKVEDNYTFEYTQKNKRERDYPKNVAAYLVDYAIEKRIQVVADYMSSEFQTYETKGGNKLWVKSMYGHKNEFAEEQFYVFGGFVEEDVCYILQFICLNRNSKYYYNDFIHFFTSASIF